MLAPGSRVAVRAYARRNPWIGLDDISQEAHLAALEAARTWRPDGGASRDWYEARAVALTLSRLVAEECAHGAHLDADELDLADPAYEPADLTLDRARALAEVRRILDEETEAARAILLAEERADTVAARLGVSVREVYDQTAAAMRSLRLELCAGGRLAAWAVES